MKKSDLKRKYKKFKHTVVATDVVIFTMQKELLKVLLVKMKKQPFLGTWAVPGGMVKVTESVDEAALRHLYHETGVKDIYLEQLYTFGTVDRDPTGRVVSVAYFALIPSNGLIIGASKGDEEVAWFPIKNLPELAYDHPGMIKYALERLKAKLGYTNIIYSLLSQKFTLTELQNLYEIILERKLDKRNFRRKFLSLGLIRKTADKKRSGAHRPAQLYRFTERKPQIVEIF